MQYVGIISVVLALLLVVEVQARRKWDKPELEISHFYPGGHYIMLTFDNLDAGEEVTLELLKVLEQRKARATFFVEGHEAENHPDLLKSMVKQRHEIANLGWQSSNSSSSDKDGDTTNSGIPHDEEILENIQKTATIVEKITGKSTTVFRPTAMANLYNQKQAELISGHGHAHPHQVVLFSLDARKAKSEKELTSLVLKHAKKGDVILCHITKDTVQAVGAVVDSLNKQGYEFLTISEMMSFPDDKPHR